MVYNLKEYKPIFDTPIKRSEELAITSRRELKYETCALCN